MMILVILVLVGWAAAADQYFVNYDCGECFANKGRQCLVKNEWTYGVCCHPDPN